MEEYDDEKKIELLIAKADQIRTKNLNESTFYYKYALELAEKKNHQKNALVAAYQLAGNFKLANSYYYALKYFIRYGEIASALKETYEMGVSFYYQGEMYYRLKNYEKAEISYLKAIEHFKKENRYNDLGDCYYNLGLLYHKSDLNKALRYYEKAHHCEQNYDLNSDFDIYLNNVACIYIQKGELKKAKIMLDSAYSISHNNNKSLSYLQSSYGEYYQEKKQYKQAEKAYLESINIHQKLSNIVEIHKLSLQLSNVYKEMNNYKLALSFYKQHKEIQDSIDKINNIKQYQKQEFEKNLKQLEHNNKIKILNQKRNDLYYRIVIFFFFILLLSIVTTILFKKKLEMKKIHLSKENQSLKESLLVEKLENKNKELTTNALLLGERNELMKNVSEKLNSCKPKLKKANVEIIQEVIDDLSSKINEKQWDEFEQNFSNLHPVFFNNLLAEFPTLSSKEVKLCSLLKLNMTSKEIAQINHMTTNSVEVSRSRLRKKLDLSNSNLSLFVFLSKY
ncbi:tetratricopeptide repeat protein [Ancylomarina sp. YFZ004]